MKFLSHMIPLLLATTLLPLSLSAQTTQPTTAPAVDPKQLFLSTIHQLQTAKTLDLEWQENERTSPTTPIANPEHLAETNMQNDTTCEFLIHRPQAIRFHRTRTDWNDVSTYSPTSIYDGAHLWQVYNNVHARPPRGTVAPLSHFTIDDLLDPYMAMGAFNSRANPLIDAASTERYFNYATDWQMLSGAEDQYQPVMRVTFTTPDVPPQHWEAWISKDEPHRLTRLIITGTTTLGITEVKASAAHDDDALMNPDKHTDFMFVLNDRVELRFTRWQINQPVPPDAFDPPDPSVHLTPTTYYENDALRLGDTVTFPPAKTASGKTLDLAHHTGPLVLEFWYANSPLCVTTKAQIDVIIAALPGSAIQFYGVNSDDPLDIIAGAETQNQWTNFPTVVDANSAYMKEFGTNGSVMIVVIDMAGRLVYRDYPTSPAALRRLKTALEKASRRFNL